MSKPDTAFTKINETIRLSSFDGNFAKSYDEELL